jgi:hypothetical protein
LRWARNVARLGEKRYTNGDLKENGHLEDLCVDGRIPLKGILII